MYNRKMMWCKKQPGENTTGMRNGLLILNDGRKIPVVRRYEDPDSAYPDNTKGGKPRHLSKELDNLVSTIGGSFRKDPNSNTLEEHFDKISEEKNTMLNLEKAMTSKKGERDIGFIRDMDETLETLSEEIKKELWVIIMSFAKKAQKQFGFDEPVHYSESSKENKIALCRKDLSEMFFLLMFFAKKHRLVFDVRKGEKRRFFIMLRASIGSKILFRIHLGNNTYSDCHNIWKKSLKLKQNHTDVLSPDTITQRQEDTNAIIDAFANPRVPRFSVDSLETLGPVLNIARRSLETGNQVMFDDAMQILQNCSIRNEHPL